MRLVSVNVRLPREVTWQNGAVTTGIFKQPVTGRVKVRPEMDRPTCPSTGDPTKRCMPIPASTTHIGATNFRI
jgi:hypothetical protein